VGLFIAIQSTYAEKSVESLDAHVHGLSELTIAMDAKSIEIQPNLTGNESGGFLSIRPSSKQDIAAV
jgi:hypothetical protein